MSFQNTMISYQKLMSIDFGLEIGLGKDYCYIPIEELRNTINRESNTGSPSNQLVRCVMNCIHPIYILS